LKLHRIFALLPLAAILSACNAVMLHPSGDVAVQQRDLIIYATELMLIVILPVAILTALFAWHFRHTNTEARYEPDWHHSTALEVVIWGVPVIIIAVLSVTTWSTAHTLDPYKAVSRIAPGQPVPPGTKPLVIEVVALDWKWLFIYPEQGIATVNDAAAPINQPIEFRLTADRVQNSLSIPAIAGQVYAMPTMETELHAVVNEPGDFKGKSSRFSGIGFSEMHFVFHGLSAADFDKWIANAKAAGGTLDTATYQQLQVPTVAEPVHRYGSIDPQLYKLAVDQCVGKSSNVCLSTLRANDLKKGNGLCRPNVASN
jgi:cytochrome o ubiquinol oxidase subunit 2